MTTDQTLKQALAVAMAALDEIALAGMSGTGQESEEAMREWHARQAWNFIAIAARAKTAIAAIEQHKPVVRMPPFGSKRAAALALYRPPFKFRMGYIYDAGGHMVADQDGFGEGSKVFDSVAARVRGWGRIGYMPDAEALQDEVGVVIAEALTAYWNNAEVNGLTIGEHG